jgi:hypothetical protein
MRKILVLVIFMFSASSFAQQVPVGDCVEVYDVKQGNNCNDPRSYYARYKNICQETIQARLCLKLREEAGELEKCFQSRLKPGKSSSGFVCKGSGGYRTEAWRVD